MLKTEATIITCYRWYVSRICIMCHKLYFTAASSHLSTFVTIVSSHALSVPKASQSGIHQLPEFPACLLVNKPSVRAVPGSGILFPLLFEGVETANHRSVSSDTGCAGSLGEHHQRRTHRQAAGSSSHRHAAGSPPTDTLSGSTW